LYFVFKFQHLQELITSKLPLQEVLKDGFFFLSLFTFFLFLLPLNQILNFLERLNVLNGNAKRIQMASTRFPDMVKFY